MVLNLLTIKMLCVFSVQLRTWAIPPRCLDKKTVSAGEVAQGAAVACVECRGACSTLPSCSVESTDC